MGWIEYLLIVAGSSLEILDVYKRQPIVIGLVLIFHSIRSIIEAVDARKYGYGGWSVGLIFSIISLIFGIICVTNAFDVMKRCV